MRPYALRLAWIVILAAVPAFAGDNERSPSPFVLRKGGVDDPHAFFEVSGLDAETIAAIQNDTGRSADVLGVYTVENAKDGHQGRPTVLGSYKVDAKAGVLRFETRFRLEKGVRYRAVFRAPGSSADTIVSETEIAESLRKGLKTAVVGVSPSRDVLPENLLKFYIEFSAPMSRGHAYEHVSLLDATGKPLDLPFLELGEELWDPWGVRFTLLFDPGRIKTGLKPREEMGPVLERGKTYTLVVGKGWLDANGTPLKADYRKTFRVGPHDVTPPDPKAWTLPPPEAGTRMPLIVRFPEPLDRAMLGRVLAVFDRAGHLVPGSAAVGAEETSWSFTPEDPWRPGGYELRVDKTLEDLAGNSIDKPFEVDDFEKVERRVAAQTVRLPFEVAGGQ